MLERRKYGSKQQLKRDWHICKCFEKKKWKENQIFDIGKYYAILPHNFAAQRKSKKLSKLTKSKKIKFGFSYSSLNNSDFLSLADLRNAVKKYMKWWNR